MGEGIDGCGLRGCAVSPTSDRLHNCDTEPTRLHSPAVAGGGVRRVAVLPCLFTQHSVFQCSGVSHRSSPPLPPMPLAMARGAPWSARRSVFIPAPALPFALARGSIRSLSVDVRRASERCGGRPPARRPHELTCAVVWWSVIRSTPYGLVSAARGWLEGAHV